jgi:aerobic carbon-monoxide dehydrogenase medium subunit
MGTLGGSVANNDPAACYPSAVLALGATIHTTAAKSPPTTSSRACSAPPWKDGRTDHRHQFSRFPKRAAYMKFKQSASRFAMVGVFLAQTASGVRVAVTGASSDGVFRHAGLEQALSANFTPQAAAGVKIDATGLNHDIHGSAAYRANLISVQTQRAVTKALG